MELNLVKTDHFNGNLIEVYADDKNEFFMTREQIGKALGYAEPKKAIEKIHARHSARLDTLSGTPTGESSWRRCSKNHSLHNARLYGNLPVEPTAQG